MNLNHKYGADLLSLYAIGAAGCGHKNYRRERWSRDLFEWVLGAYESYATQSVQARTCRGSNKACVRGKRRKKSMFKKRNDCDI